MKAVKVPAVIDGVGVGGVALSDSMVAVRTRLSPAKIAVTGFTQDQAGKVPCVQVDFVPPSAPEYPAAMLLL